MKYLNGIPRLRRLIENLVFIESMTVGQWYLNWNKFVKASKWKPFGDPSLVNISNPL